jgi:hypothetical protein
LNYSLCAWFERAFSNYETSEDQILLSLISRISVKFLLTHLLNMFVRESKNP